MESVEVPTKEGYTFLGWSEIPEIMPAHDITVTGSFTTGNQDTEGPIIESFTFEPTTIDITNSSQTVTVTAHVTDESGVSRAPVVYIQLTGKESATQQTGWFSLTSGDMYDGIYTAVITIPQGKEGGEWKVSSNQFYDKNGYASVWPVYPTSEKKTLTVINDPSLHKYFLTYQVDAIGYKSYELDYGATITPEIEPTKEGYTFSGWSEIPETMPAHDVIVTGSFTINQYLVTYIVDGVVIKTEYVNYASKITPPSVPEREGYSFTWNEYPKTMPAKGLTITGQYTINKYKLAYTVDGEEYKSYETEYGATITPERTPTKEGYTFSGWSEIPATMPAHDVTVSGTFTVNKYKITYIMDNKVYKEVMCEYGATVTPEPQPEGVYDTFEWIGQPETMPAHDVVVYAMYTSGITDYLIDAQQNVRIYAPNGKKLNKLQKGLNIVVQSDGTIKKVVVK